MAPAEPLFVQRRGSFGRGRLPRLVRSENDLPARSPPMTASHRSARRRALSIASTVVASGLVLTAAVLPSSADTASSSPRDAVQQSLTALVRDDGFPAALASVRGRDGRVRDYTAGVGDLATKSPVPVNGMVRIASNTKTFVS